ncbi:MAG: hypothetical protein MUQ30_19400 [Anaerolineae bacterium]|nr:hypothetical protein [Anaerolineae bacterium]
MVVPDPAAQIGDYPVPGLAEMARVRKLEMVGCDRVIPVRPIAGDVRGNQSSGERYHEAELYRLRGELRLLQAGNNAAQAAGDFHRAIEVAQRQSAKMIELRAAMSLCNLWRGQGAGQALATAREHLAEVYDWFTEGFDTLDLQEAQALLAELDG